MGILINGSPGCPGEWTSWVENVTNVEVIRRMHKELREKWDMS